MVISIIEYSYFLRLENFTTSIPFIFFFNTFTHWSTSGFERFEMNGTIDFIDNI